MSNKTYDIIKFIATVVLPAVATLVIGICSIWHIPNGEAIGATLTAINTCLGLIVTKASYLYSKEGK